MTPERILAHLDAGTTWPAADAATVSDDTLEAYRAAFALRRLREARGEKVVGYKIGFTNRTIWERYAVFGPIWGPVYDSTLTWCEDESEDGGEVTLAPSSLPRLEPECALGLRATPPAGATLAQLFDCVEWYAPSFEVVQSHLPDWKFSAAQTVTDGALHARLLVGRRTPVRELAATGEAFDSALAATAVRLLQGDQVKDRGIGANVLDGPLHALLHFVHELERIPGAPSLGAGEVITTGTWTDAWPLEAGQTWRADFDPPMRPLTITLR
jgi:2-keto-4-pentenoate hydratase